MKSSTKWTIISMSMVLGVFLLLMSMILYYYEKEASWLTWFVWYIGLATLVCFLRVNKWEWVILIFMILGILILVFRGG